MNTILKTAFVLYQAIFKTNNRSCRYTPTCSQYLLDAGNKYGAIKGIYLALRRILSCHPLSNRPIYDPA